MSKIHSKDTLLELRVRNYLWTRGFRYRKNERGLFGCPDLSFRGKKTVIFIDSCFWHGCKQHCRLPKSNIAYWKEKIEKNKQRDKWRLSYYATHGWRLIQVWEHDLKEPKMLEEIAHSLSNV